MSRLNISEQSVEQIIKTAQDDLEQIKVKQYAGASNLVLVENSTEDAYDTSLTLSSSGGSGFFYCEFQADHLKLALADMTYRVWVDGTGSGNEVFPGDVLYPFEDQRIQNIFSDNPNFLDRSTWNFFLWNFDPSSSHTYYLKYYVVSTDTGVVSPIGLP